MAKDIFDYFNDSTEIQQVLLHETENKHLGFMFNILKDGESVHKKLFEYGITNLPENTNRPDILLSAYFFLLSELKDLSIPARDLALDGMTYSENHSDFPTSSMRELQEQYKKVFS